MPVPPDFVSRRLPIIYFNNEHPLMRIYKVYPDKPPAAVYYGTSGNNRFDSPTKTFGVTYAAHDLGTCFAETITREGNVKPFQHGGIMVSRQTDVLPRRVATLECSRPLKLASMIDIGLYGIGAEAGEFNSVDYANTTQLWAEQLHSRYEMVDGIYYRSRFLNGRLAMAIFERGGTTSLIVTSDVELSKHPSYCTVLTELNIALVA